LGGYIFFKTSIGSRYVNRVFRADWELLCYELFSYNVVISVGWFLLLKRNSNPSSNFFLKFQRTLSSGSRILSNLTLLPKAWTWVWFHDKSQPMYTYPSQIVRNPLANLDPNKPTLV
jgi:hypothetical protein